MFNKDRHTAKSTGNRSDVKKIFFKLAFKVERTELIFFVIDDCHKKSVWSSDFFFGAKTNLVSRPTLLDWPLTWNCYVQST